ncbi:MAG: hypothetical protein ACYSVY_00320 [Planctomycetota bacterium]|jgi:hypothetical protein
MDLSLVRETLWNGNRDANYRGEFKIAGQAVVIEICRAYYPFDSTARVFIRDGKRSRFAGSLAPDEMQTNRALRSGYDAARQPAFEADVEVLLEMARKMLQKED